MQKLSGLVLDVYDDPDGEVLREIFPTYARVPEVIKEAHALSQEERAELPDDLYALVLIDEDTVLRKLACVDSGNTALSVSYFLKTAHKLPDEAQKTAARNLITACGWYGITPPGDLEKIALLGGAWRVGKLLHGGSLGAGLALAQTPGILKETAKQTKMGLNAARAAGSNINPAILR